MRIESVNVGRRQRLKGRSFDAETGILKNPVHGPVAVGAFGLAGDAVVNTRHHGGPDQAVYLYRQEDYEWWSGQLERPTPPGTFGENLTISGFPAPGAAIGTRLQFATVLLEVSAPRIPCNTLAARMGDTAFVKAFVQAVRPGFYCRVIVPGELAEGEPFEVAGAADPEAPTTIELFQASLRRPDPQALRRFLAAPIDARTRRKFSKLLAGD